MVSIPIKSAYYITKNFVTNNAHIILAIKGAVGVGTTAYLAVKATPKALAAIENAEKEKGKGLTYAERFKCTYKYYIPAAIEGATSIAAILGGAKISNDKITKAVGAYLVSEETVDFYRKKLEENLSGEEVKKINEQLSSKKSEKAIAPDVTISGDQVLYYEMLSNQYFVSSPIEIASALNNINNELKYISGECTVNQALYLLHADDGNPLLYDYGWTKDADEEIEISINEGPLKNGVYPTASITFYPSPHRFY